ncbi:TPA: hypothetical protein NJL90_004371 [Pseudomonas aeruginosa]|nr:hypothetical protein [Pseudomonas aeruginosa]HCG0574342.1 hypothetical protein [Pseudomonas aeruginosa]HCG0580474.1 hypothetical protein [Pseudomonas aeruginosa]HCG0589480.1 hypothetical protein [Pseudomonas aeruginosa]HCG0668749.1 hypothetical protein [Pseudomonas aeruginosa]
MKPSLASPSSAQAADAVHSASAIGVKANRFLIAVAPSYSVVKSGKAGKRVVVSFPATLLLASRGRSLPWGAQPGATRKKRPLVSAALRRRRIGAIKVRRREVLPVYFRTLETGWNTVGLFY